LSKIHSLLVSGFLVGLLCGCSTVWSGNRQSDEPNVTKGKLQQYEKMMHVTFPGSTRGLNAREVTGGPDAMLYLKVEMDKEELESFLKSSPFANADLRSDRPFVYNQKGVTWWTPADVKTYKSGQASLPDGEVLNVLIDLGQDKKVVIYLMWHET